MEKLVFLTGHLKDITQKPEKPTENLVATEENLEVKKVNSQLFLNQFTLEKTQVLEKSFSDENPEDLNLHSHKIKIDLSIN